MREFAICVDSFMDKQVPEKFPVAEAVHHVIGIGASAGGLEALSQFVAGLPRQIDCIYVFERWIEVKSGYSRPWSNEEKFVAGKFRNNLLRWL